MNRDALSALLSSLEPLSKHCTYLLGIARPCVRISFAAGKTDPAGSRFGGHPFVPADFAWPRHEIGEYRFLGQIDFADIDFGEDMAPQAPLPDSGLLSLFYAEDEDGEVFWGDDGYVLGFYWAETSGHRLLRSGGGDAAPARGLAFSPSLDLPRHRELRGDWPDDEDALEYLFHEYPKIAGAHGDHLLGYPAFRSLAYDPTPGPEWQPLLNLRSHEDFGWCWHDGDSLMLFVEAVELARRNFGEIKSDAG